VVVLVEMAALMEAVEMAALGAQRLMLVLQ
jgi:hypothetical protein